MELCMRDRERVKVLDAVKRGDVSQREAGGLMGLSLRQTKRLLKRYREEGDEGIIHRLRGRVSNRRITEELRKKVEGLIEERYRDFGPTLAMEYLGEKHGIFVSRETLRKWMSCWGFWQEKRRRVKHREWRERKGCFGEMVQMDTSEHDWFEGRGEKAYLILMIDDATSRINARFYRTDSTETNMDLLKRYFRRYGRPKAIYADKASHFKTTRPTTIEEELAGRKSETQIGRALRELDVRYIAAHSPQAKGRVERSFCTAQDRLVKGMRVEGISTIDMANEYLTNDFIPRWNRWLVVKPAKPLDAHRTIKGLDLNAFLSVQEYRVVANDYTIQFQKRLFQVKKASVTAGLRKGKVLIESRLDGSIHIRFRKAYLKFREIAQERRPFKSSDRAVTPVGLRPPSVTAQHIQQPST